MKKLALMKKFMKNFVGKGFHLVIKEKEGSFKVHTIEIMQKTDDSCPVEDLPVGDYFLRLVATNPQGNEASIVSDWSDDLLKNLLSNHKEAKDAQYSQVTMFRDPLSKDPNRWLLTWGSENTVRKKDPVRYIS
ncbi:hypothetical protein E4G67_00960 [Candidatus Bathyarchaeota archaeon]|nr:MAG: hypothetical protein E4G67_00960 [Candidatus Bathyarchaeota archaeon]